MTEWEPNNFTTRETERILRFVDWHWEEMGHAPSLRAIGKAVGIKSPATAFEVVSNLVRQGLLERLGTAKAIRVVPTARRANCKHLWRVENPDEEELNLICELCGRKTAIDYEPDPDDMKTWLIYGGEA
jgi:SOS-response transcriptional repressor LexA